MRPGIWPTVFTERKTGREQDFMKCVEQSHASWLVDSGVLSQCCKMSKERKKKAEAGSRRMANELFASSVSVADGELKLTLVNRGVAPFYYDWPVELRIDKVLATD